MKGKDLDKATIDTYHAWVQHGIRNNLNSISLGPGKLPFRAAVFLFVFGLCCLLTGILVVALRMRHVYLWDWNAQFLGPFFVILFLLCLAGTSYLLLIAKRRSNKYRSQLYFKPLGDWGVSCLHESELAREQELKHELKSGTNPHKTVKPRSEAYSQSSKTARIHLGSKGDGRDNQGYDKSPLDSKPFKPDDQRKRPPPPDGRRGPPPDGRHVDPHLMADVDLHLMIDVGLHPMTDVGLHLRVDEDLHQKGQGDLLLVKGEDLLLLNIMGHLLIIMILSHGTTLIGMDTEAHLLQGKVRMDRDQEELLVLMLSKDFQKGRMDTEAHLLQGKVRMDRDQEELLVLMLSKDFQKGIDKMPSLSSTGHMTNRISRKKRSTTVPTFQVL
ncbi:hypothetical protein PoB_002490000 [Plakobranchus ocellatus]|uniref:Uncharacterized protein n=1 Tax=Plakobranchus ocellatus TaxID=259542 RepID=A0AAV3ZUU4_9GAST|nr:hypothetical protein PoB_002490000 [Plakobranchus ocellatus]